VGKLQGTEEERAATAKALRAKAAVDASARGACLLFLCPSAPHTQRPARHAAACAHLSPDSAARGRARGRRGCGRVWVGALLRGDLARGLTRPHARHSHALTHVLLAHARTHSTGSHSAQDARAIEEGLTRGVSAETSTLALQQQRSDKHIKLMAIHMAKVQVQGSSSSGGK